MATTVVTGSGSGIGAAIARRLAGAGERVIGVDLRGGEIGADLGRPEGRAAALARIREHLAVSAGRDAVPGADPALDRLVLSAGVGTSTRPIETIPSVNYFGAIELLDALLPELARGQAPAALAVCSNSAQMVDFLDTPYVQALLDGDEETARAEIVREDNAFLAYAGSKQALGVALRRRAGTWGRAGVRLNAIAPGPVETPLLEADRALFGAAIDGLDLPLGRHGRPDEVAALAAFLLGDEAAWIHGSIVFIDGGNDAAIRPDRF